MTFTIKYDSVILIILFILLIFGTFKIGFSKSLIIIILAFGIDFLLGMPIQNLLKFNFFALLFSLIQTIFFGILKAIKDVFVNDLKELPKTIWDNIVNFGKSILGTN